MNLTRLLASLLSRLAQIPLLKPMIPLGKRLFGAARLGEFREALIVPAAGAAPGAETGPISWSVDCCWPVPGVGHLIVGWCMDPVHRIQSMRLDTGQELMRNWVRLARTDVIDAFPRLSTGDPNIGFIVLACSGRPELMPVIECRQIDGSTERRALRLDDRGSALHFTREVLGRIDPAHPQLRELIERHVGPAITAAWTLERQIARTPELRWFGDAPAAPEASILVPLYGRYDFLRYQLALFADDPDMARCELIYIVDDPRILADVLKLAGAVQPLFGLPFAVVHCARNLGFAGANNLGASVARGEHLLLVNSDVMPRAPGWLARTLQALDELPEVGVIGAQLLYEDGSVQHAGMGRETYVGWGGFAINSHPGKGLPPDASQTAAREVEAVTGAFMALRRELYLELGGLDEGFVLGDFEDSDLCRRLRSKGLRAYLLPDVQLYHLERQSQILAGAPHWKSLLSLINCWRHERLASGSAT